MLNIQCAQCGETLKGKEVKVTPFNNYIEGVKYKDYAVTCPKCGGLVTHERYAKMSAEGKAKAMIRLAKKKKKTVKEISEEERYCTIMRKVGKFAKANALTHKDNPVVKQKDLNKAIEELPKDEKKAMLAYEDKMDMELLKNGVDKPQKNMSPNSMLLLSQAIIESAIKENDEDFFEFEYGAQIVEIYNTMLTARKCHDYGITADLLLEKMRKNAIKVKGEQEDD